MSTPEEEQPPAAVPPPEADSWREVTYARERLGHSISSALLYLAMTWMLFEGGRILMALAGAFIAGLQSAFALWKIHQWDVHRQAAHLASERRRFRGKVDA